MANNLPVGYVPVAGDNVIATCVVEGCGYDNAYIIKSDGEELTCPRCEENGNAGIKLCLQRSEPSAPFPRS